MNKFLKSFLLFLIPLVGYLVIVYIIDPYNFFDKKDSLISDNIKLETSYKLNYPLYELINFDENPTQYILLGDSRVENLGTKYFKDYSGYDFTNLAYGGGTLIESINTFWEISKKHNLKEVYFGLNFDSYNGMYGMDRVSEAIIIKSNFIKYAFSKYSMKSMAIILKRLIFDTKVVIGKPSLTRDEYWEYQLNSSANNRFRIYKYPKNYFIELEKIANYCKSHNIKLIFFSSPTHVDLQRKILEYNLADEYKKFQEDLKSLSTFYDFNYRNKFTENRNNFIDPYHIQKENSNQVVKEFFSNKKMHVIFHDFNTNDIE